jgi:hypothetical protein
MPFVIDPQATFKKTPGERIDYVLTWSGDGFLPDGDPIADVTWTVPTELAQGAGPFASSNTDTTTTIWLLSAEPGSYDVACEILSAAGLRFERTFRVVVLERFVVGGYVQDPSDQLVDYELDWVDRLAEGDSVASSSWSADAFTIGDGAFEPTLTGSVVKVWLSDGDEGTQYATSIVNTAAGRILERSIRIVVTDL